MFCMVLTCLTIGVLKKRMGGEKWGLQSSHLEVWPPGHTMMFGQNGVGGFAMEIFKEKDWASCFIMFYYPLVNVDITHGKDPPCY